MPSFPIAILGLILAQTTQPAAPLAIRPAHGELVIVDAYVTDRKGRPIADLRQEDFVLFEDDQVKEISAFSAPSTTNANEPEREVARARAGNEPPRDLPTLVIYADRRLLSPSGRKRGLDQAAGLAESHIARGARVVVLADEGGLQALTPLTMDVGAVRAALTRIQGWITVSPSASDARTALDTVKTVIEGNEVAGCDCVCSLQQTVQVMRGYAMNRDIEAREAADRLTLVVNSLVGLPGRKALVYVSEGLEERPGIQLFDQLGKICPEALRRDASTIFAAMQEMETWTILREVTVRANAARVTLYPIDARGLRTFSAADPSYGDRAYTPSAGNDLIRDVNLKAPLQRLGEDTGGFALVNGLDPETAMKRFDADARGHYVLAFVPGEADGRAHTLRVRLTDKVQAKRNADLRHRQAYLRAELPARRGQRALSALLFGLEENTLGVAVDLRRLDAATVGLKVSLPVSALRPAPGAEAGEARVHIVIALRPTQGERPTALVREKEAIFNLAEGAEGGERREIVVDVPVGPGGYELAIGLEDAGSGSASYLRRSLEAERE